MLRIFGAVSVCVTALPQLLLTLKIGHLDSPESSTAGTCRRYPGCCGQDASRRQHVHPWALPPPRLPPVVNEGTEGQLKGFVTKLNEKPSLDRRGHLVLRRRSKAQKVEEKDGFYIPF